MLAYQFKDQYRQPRSRTTDLQRRTCQPTEVTHQATVKARQSGNGRYVVLLAQRFDLAERIGHVAALGHFAGVFHFQLVAAQAIHALGRQADDGIAAPGGAPLDRLEQEGVRAVGQLQVHRQRRVEVGKHLTHQRDAGMTLRCQRVETATQIRPIDSVGLVLLVLGIGALQVMLDRQ